jgi:hypothetical protein
MVQTCEQSDIIRAIRLRCPASAEGFIYIFAIRPFIVTDRQARQTGQKSAVVITVSVRLLTDSCRMFCSEIHRIDLGCHRAGSQGPCRVVSAIWSVSYFDVSAYRQYSHGLRLPLWRPTWPEHRASYVEHCVCPQYLHPLVRCVEQGQRSH